MLEGCGAHMLECPGETGCLLTGCFQVFIQEAGKGDGLRLVLKPNIC